jgi:hypothetical protein
VIQEFPLLVRGKRSDRIENHLFERPDEILKPASKVETAYHKADRAIQQVLDLLAAA